jgi:hypothetical protein
VADLRADDSHASRLNFERVSGYGLCGMVFLYGGVGLISKALADRVVELAPALSTLAGVLGAVMGASWFRGHMDKRLESE